MGMSEVTEKDEVGSPGVDTKEEWRFPNERNSPQHDQSRFLSSSFGCWKGS